MTTSDPAALVQSRLDAFGVDYEVIACDLQLADTEVFCAHYGYALEDSANTIVVGSKTGEQRFAACVLLAHTRLDVNRVVRKRLGVRRISFASGKEWSPKGFMARTAFSQPAKFLPGTMKPTCRAK